MQGERRPRRPGGPTQLFWSRVHGDSATRVIPNVNRFNHVVAWHLVREARRVTSASEVEARRGRPEDINNIQTKGPTLQSCMDVDGG